MVILGDWARSPSMVNSFSWPSTLLTDSMQKGVWTAIFGLFLLIEGISAQF